MSNQKKSKSANLQKRIANYSASMGGIGERLDELKRDLSLERDRLASKDKKIQQMVALDAVVDLLAIAMMACASGQNGLLESITKHDV